jgi:hypothetical protein
MHCFIVTIAAIVLVGCNNEPASIPEDAPAAARPNTPHRSDQTAITSSEQAESRPKPAPPSVKLLDPGKEPRRALRSNIAPEDGSTLKISVSSEIDALMGILHARQAPRSVTFELTVQAENDVLDNGRTFSFKVDKAAALHEANIPLNVRKSRREALATMQGLEGSYLVDPLGMVEEVVMNLSPDASSEVRSLAEDLRWALRQLAVPVPMEPVGTGATWTIDRRVEQDGVNANEVSTLEVVKLRQRLVTLTADVEQGATPQTFRNPGSSADVELTQFAGKGTGEIVWDPTQGLPRSAKMTSTVTRHATYQSEGKPVRNVIVTRRTLAIVGPRH